MEILVCMKQVPDDSVEIRLNAAGEPDLSQADPQGNAFDTYALELAVRYTEENGGSVTVVTVGPEDNKVCLKNALAVGAAKAYHISDDGIDGADAFVTAGLLAGAVAKIEEELGAKFDVILCGKESTDTIGSEVGEILAEKLGLPFVTNIVEIKAADGKITSKKELDAGYMMIETALPSIFTVSKPDYDPRYPTIKSKLAARKVQIPSVASGELTLKDGDLQAKVSYLGYIEPPKREAGVKIKEEDPADSVAKAFEIMAADKVL